MSAPRPPDQICRAVYDVLDHPMKLCEIRKASGVDGYYRCKEALSWMLEKGHVIGLDRSGRTYIHFNRGPKPFPADGVKVDFARKAVLDEGRWWFGGLMKAWPLSTIDDERLDKLMKVKPSIRHALLRF